MESMTFHRQGGTIGIMPSALPSGTKGTFWWMSTRPSELKGINLATQEGLWDAWVSHASRLSYEKVGLMVKGTHKESLAQWKLQDRDPLLKWTSREGRMVLLGDACHAAHPPQDMVLGWPSRMGFGWYKLWAVTRLLSLTKRNA